MISLQENRTGFIDLVINFGAGRLVALHLIVNLYPIEGDTDFVANNVCFGGLPLKRGRKPSESGSAAAAERVSSARAKVSGARKGREGLKGLKGGGEIRIKVLGLFDGLFCLFYSAFANGFPSPDSRPSAHLMP